MERELRQVLLASTLAVFTVTSCSKEEQDVNHTAGSDVFVNESLVEKDPPPPPKLYEVRWSDQYGLEGPPFPIHECWNEEGNCYSTEVIAKKPLPKGYAGLGNAMKTGTIKQFFGSPEGVDVFTDVSDQYQHLSLLQNGDVKLVPYMNEDVDNVIFLNAVDANKYFYYHIENNYAHEFLDEESEYTYDDFEGDDIINVNMADVIFTIRIETEK